MQIFKIIYNYYSIKICCSLKATKIIEIIHLIRIIIINTARQCTYQSQWHRDYASTYHEKFTTTFYIKY